MNIRLVELKALSNNVYDQSRLPRLGQPQIAAILGQHGHDVLIYVETLAPVNLDDLLRADLVGISSTTGTTPPSYALADKLRAAGVPVVFGGSHVTFRADEALDHADYVVRGEGHATMLELVQALESGGSVEDIIGLSYWRDGQKVHNPARPNCDEATFAGLPVPDLTRIVGYEKMVTYPVMTQWGCPFDCNFCSVIKMFGRRVRARPVEDVLAQLEQIPPGGDIFFYDDNLVVDKRRTKELLRGMIERGLTIPWSAQMRAEAVLDKRTGEWDTELLELMRDSNCVWVYIGFESVNPDALKEFNKKQTVDDIAESIRAFHAYGIPIHGMFVLGCDADTPETIESTVQFAIRQGIDTVQFMTITPFPGTEFYDDMAAEGRILSDDWSLYDGHHVVIQPQHMTPYELQMAAFRAMLRFYAPRRAFRLLIGNIVREMPFLVSLFVRERKLRIVLPRIARIGFRKEDAVMQVQMLLQKALDAATWLRLRAVFVVPMFRQYAYKHTRQGLRQPINQAYVEQLRKISKKLGGQEKAHGTSS